MRRNFLTVFSLAVAALAQSAGPAGHWEGAIQTPNDALQFSIDLAPDSGSGWIGTISIPAQNTKGLPLTDVRVMDHKVSFGLKAPGDPRFQGTVGKDGRMTGELLQGGLKMPFELARTGEANVEKPPSNPPLSKELEGTWEGALAAEGQRLRLRFVLSNQAGAGTGSLYSLDQGGSEIPVGRIAQTGTHVRIEVPVVVGAFEGDLSEGQLSGKWSQGGASLPLTLARPAK